MRLNHPDQRELSFPEPEPTPVWHPGVRIVLKRLFGRGDLPGSTFEKQQEAGDILGSMDHGMTELELHQRIAALDIHLSGVVLAEHAKIDFWQVREGRNLTK